jgi:predicted nucleotidyltransferase
VEHNGVEHPHRETPTGDLFLTRHKHVSGSEEDPQTKRRRIAMRVAEELGNQEDVIGILLEGSVGRGEAQLSSDIDILCVATSTSSLKGRFFFREGIPVNLTIQAEESLEGLDAHSKWSLLNAEAILDPRGRIRELQERWGRTIIKGDNKPRLAWLEENLRGDLAIAQSTDDPFSEIVFLRDAADWAISHYLLAEEGVLRVRSDDLNRLHTRVRREFVRLLDPDPLLEETGTIRRDFCRIEEEMGAYVERNRETISDLQKHIVTGACRKHRSREFFFQIEQGNWLRGIQGLRNHVNRLYPYSIAEANSFRKPDFIGKLLDLADPPSYSSICRKVNCFAENITPQLHQARQDANAILGASHLAHIWKP